MNFKKCIICGDIIIVPFIKMKGRILLLQKRKICNDCKLHIYNFVVKEKDKK